MKQRRHNDFFFSSLIQKVKERLKKLVQALKHKRNPWYVKTMLIVSKLVTYVGAVTALIGGGVAVSDYLHVQRRLRQFNHLLRTQQQELLRNPEAIAEQMGDDPRDDDRVRDMNYRIVACTSVIGTMIAVLGEIVNRKMMKVARK